MVGDYQYNEGDFLWVMFWSLTSIIQITSLQVNKEKLLIDSFSLLTYYIFLLFELKDW